ncbi:hypothetical protein J5N97_022234 [Dioscorea zingiberensis]|uniref:DUF4005 domain-containing protein n=1 Tax=Dioscorea zingiberensis TaxID=325984 RepID=A0A9D5CB46_9LILI|nr:hypothetical protein J5N97_022234 [Dioscorea zingiberensis]
MAAASKGEQRPTRWLDRWATLRASYDGRTNRGRSSLDQRDGLAERTWRGDNRSASSSLVASPRCQHQQATAMPNYMVATESAKARTHSQSAERQRTMTPERDFLGGATAKKPLSFPEGYCQSLCSQSFKSAMAWLRSSYNLQSSTWMDLVLENEAVHDGSMKSVVGGERLCTDRHCWSLRLDEMAWSITFSCPLLLG